MSEKQASAWREFLSFGVGWRQVGICFVLLAAVSMIASSWSIVAVPFLHEFHPTRFVMGLAMTVLSGASAIISPFLGNMMDRRSLRLMMMTGGVLMAAGYASLSLATNFDHVLIIFGLLIAPSNVLLGPVASTVLLSRWFAKRRGTAIGVAIAGVAAGSIVFPFIIQGLLDAFEWREAYRLFGLLLLVITVPAAALVINRPEDRGMHPDGALIDLRDNAGAAKRQAPNISAIEVLTDPAFWLTALVVATVTSGMKGMVTNLAPLALDQKIDPTLAAGLVSIYGMGGLVAKVGFAVLADIVSPRKLMIASLGGFGAGMAMLTQAQGGYSVIVSGVVLIGMFGGLMVPMQSFLMPRIFGERVVGKAMGLISMVTLVALLSTPPLFGLIFDLFGSYAGIFYAFTGLAVAVMLAVPFIRLHPRRVSEEDRAEAMGRQLEEEVEVA